MTHQPTLWEAPQALQPPAPTRTKGLGYQDALGASEGGSWVRRSSWSDGAYAYREGGRWYLVTHGKAPRRWTPTLCDQGAKNWTIYREEVAA